MSLITEHNIETASLDGISVGSAPPSEPPTNADGAVATSGNLPEVVSQLGREVAEMQVQLHNLRTELVRSSAAVTSATRNIGMATMITVIVATYLIVSTRGETIGIKAESATDEVVTQRINELGGLIHQLDSRIETLANGITEQKQASNLALKAAERTVPVSLPGEKLDCAKLPKDVKGSEADFSIQFQSGSAKILPGSEATLDGIAKMLALVPTYCVVIEGHADATGNTEKNIALSKERAVSVLDYIANKSNLNRSQLVAVGKGSSSPPAGTDALDPANRRVIFKVVAPGN